MATNRTNRAQERSEASKQQIIEAAVELVAERGIGKSTLKVIAEKAGVSSALVVFHFKSKDNLMREVLKHLQSVYASGWQKSLQLDGAPAAERLMRIVSYDLEFPRQHSKYLAAWHAFWGETEGGKLYEGIGRAGDDRCLRDIRLLVDDIADNGRYNGVDCQSVAETIYVMTFGHWHVAHTEAERYDTEFARKTFLDYLSARFPNENW
ncbi:MAG: TetR/AcrR family transcriptional regulator [Hyphomicrobiales bacterium]